MRDFGKIGSSIWRSKKFRTQSRLARLLYLYLHSCRMITSVGGLVSPPEMIAFEMQEPQDEIRQALDDLEECGLIRRDPEEELIQIVDFFRHNTPTNRNHMSGSMKSLKTLPSCELTDRIAAEFALSLVSRALTWDRTVDARGAFLDAAKGLIERLDLAHFYGAEIALSKDLSIALSEDLFIDLSNNRDRNDTETETQTVTVTETTTETETQTARAGSVGGPGAKKTSRSATRAKPHPKAPKDVTDSIEELRRRSKGKG